MSDTGDHTHRWRATSKVFALVCDCGTVYHNWLLAEIDKLKATTATPPEPLEPYITQADLDNATAVTDRLHEELAKLRASSQAEIDRLRVALESAQHESTALRGELHEARLALEVQAEEVAAVIGGA